MKLGSKIAIGFGFLAGLGILIYSKVSRTKNLVKSLQFLPFWYGSVSDMQIDINKGIKLPLGLDIMNRSESHIKIRIDSFEAVNRDGTTIAYSAPGTYEAELLPQQTARIKNLNIWIPQSVAISLIASGITSLINSDSSTILNKAKSLINGCVFNITATVNDSITASIQVDMEGGEVTLDGLGLVCAEDRKIRPLSEYVHFLPNQDNLLYEDPFVISDVEPQQTAAFIRRVAEKYKGDTKILANELKGNTNSQTVQNIWNFVANYIKYTEDSKECEQVRRPLRTLYDQKGDCDCYSALIASICENLNLNYIVRIAEYEKRGYFQHVYVIIEGMPCDPVTDRCFYEKPYTDKKDF